MKSDINVNTVERIASALVGLILVRSGFKSRSIMGAIPVGLGLSLLKRGGTGRCALYRRLDINTAWHPANQGLITGSVTIQRSPQELYALWRDPDIFAGVFQHFAEVAVTSEKSSHWKLKAPPVKEIEWDATITEERPGEFIRWEAVANSALPNWGTLTFNPGPGDKGTEVTMHLHFDPQTKMQKGLGKVLKIFPQSIAVRALRRFKSIAETGELPTVDPQPQKQTIRRDYESALLGRG